METVIYKSGDRVIHTFYGPSTVQKLMKEFHEHFTPSDIYIKPDVRQQGYMDVVHVDAEACVQETEESLALWAQQKSAQRVVNV